jgi:hypothetical protein
LAGVDRTVELTAETLYEAVAQALGIPVGGGDREGLTELKVRVKQLMALLKGEGRER